MAYKTEELEAQALEVITKYELLTIEDVVSMLPCSKPTFYEHKLNESNAIKGAIEANKVSIKNHLRNKWKDSDSPALQVALYKLAGTNDEVLRLSNGKREITGKDGKELFQKSEMDKYFESLSEDDKRKMAGLEPNE